MKRSSALQTLLTQSYEAEKNLRHFSSVTSSELTTLLASILGELENADSKTSIEAAQKAAEKALFITKNLRYFSINSHPVTALTDISQLVLDAISSVETDFSKSKIRFDAQVETSVFAIVDPVAFEQAILNLLWFCAYEMKAGGIIHFHLQVFSNGIQIALSSESDAAQKNQSIELIPIPIESLGNDSIAVLGVQVARTLIELHSGKLNVFQSPSEGTHFISELPFDSRVNKPHLLHEKRRFKRAVVNLEGELSVSGKPTLSCRISILSVGGCFAALSHDWVKKFRVEDRISLKIFTEAQSQIEIPLARIANTHPQSEHSGLGIEFLETDVKAKNLLAALVKAHAS